MTTFFESLVAIFNNNIGLVTFLVGFTAIYLYVKQRRDKKRDAGSLILQEIRYAEQKIRGYLAYDEYKLWDKVLPTNSWNDNVHLFLKDLEESEIDLISNFYSKAMYIDILIGKISDMKNTLMTPIQSTPIVSPVQQVTPSPIQPVQQVTLTSFSNAILKETSLSVEFVYNTPAGEKLKNISNKKWYQLF